jgi:hypothetical protein
MANCRMKKMAKICRQERIATAKLSRFGQYECIDTPSLDHCNLYSSDSNKSRFSTSSRPTADSSSTLKFCGAGKAPRPTLYWRSRWPNERLRPWSRAYPSSTSDAATLMLYYISAAASPPSASDDATSFTNSESGPSASAICSTMLFLLALRLARKKHAVWSLQYDSSGGQFSGEKRKKSMRINAIVFVSLVVSKLENLVNSRLASPQACILS